MTLGRPLQIKTIFFASYRDLLGTNELLLDLPEGATVGDAVAHVRSRGGAFEVLPTKPAVAVNQNYAPAHLPLADGDELAFIPPVAGG
jgi:molybdopterin converting factor subunit 1